MVAAGNALDMLGTLSVGGFVLLLAIALPLLSLDGPRSWMLRTASAVVGALQLALLVAIGGFAPLEWGLFALLALAGQWLAWREDRPKADNVRASLKSGVLEGLQDSHIQKLSLRHVLLLRPIAGCECHVGAAER
jgi:hypothetical protein